ncbi:molybdopterin molybdotransferase MoeA [Glaciihabitans sp. INWT7]|uniref:molybdopterin molybdotransferase MoeA n=1 Tax=Glaciihabitans sp. INWT7 TaxID=2596912 RepID=UPI0016287437|nr:gephyrin-like molybdotransferase Glp [Glaciihabitans sp. INWT7]QNE46064.1 molybdopterin molybdotransferase MoeA [Glaciihabitans sp. INWT7]
MTHRSVEEYVAHVRALIAPAIPTGSETVELGAALGRMTAAAILSPVDLPLFRNSQMDGFAVVAADLAKLPVTLPVVGEVAAQPGTPRPLAAGTAVRIMTGAVVPEGADAVVPVEDTTATGDSVTITRARTTGEFVRERGSDLRTGDPLLPAGLRLASRHLAALAAAGIDEVVVRRRARLAVISTGAELTETGRRAGPGEIYDSNGTALTAAVTACGAEVTLAIVSSNDELSQLRGAMLMGVANADIILTSGGISMGEHEVVRDFLQTIGGEVGHIAMQPGGPQATGVFNGVPVISFPGNPVSTQLSFEVFVAPILREAAGLPAAQRQQRDLSADVRSAPGRRQFLRGRALPDGRVEVVGGPSSHLVAGLAAADLLIDIPQDTIQLKEGDPVETIDL